MKWGILATGRIAHVFAAAINYVPSAKLYAVASRSLEKADAFREEFGAEKAYGSYEELVKDPEVDVVYIATPMITHYEDTKLCFSYNKNVLCEKSATMNAAELEELMEIARKKGLFFMEAMWTRCHPGFQKALEWVREGRIGDHVQMVRADISKFIEYNGEDRIFKKELGGGSLLDLAVYTTSMCTAFLGNRPLEITACYVPTPSGTDLVNSVLMKYPDRAFAAMNSGFGFYTPVSAIILGEKGRIEFDEFFHRTNSITLYDTHNVKIDRFEKPHELNGYEDEVKEVEYCLSHGLTESRVNPLEDSLGVMRILDEIRRQWEE